MKDLQVFFRRHDAKFKSLHVRYIWCVEEFSCLQVLGINIAGRSEDLRFVKSAMESFTKMKNVEIPELNKSLTNETKYRDILQ